MSIKSELKEQYRLYKKEMTEKDLALEKEARKFIEDFIIPKFREIAKKKPGSNYLRIGFSYGMGGCFYNSDINKENVKISYDYYMVSKAVKLANEYEISANEYDDRACGRDITFYLDLED